MLKTHKTTLCQCGRPKYYRAQQCKACANRSIASERWERQNDEALVKERFLAKVDRSGGCWLWTRARDKDGYGLMRAWGNQWRAHRLSYHLFRGPIPNDTVVCHACDNPSCVNPDHLFLGTNTDNTADRNRKGRTARGEQTAHNKLTAEQVRELRCRYETGEKMACLARAFGVTQATAWSIVRRQSWKHV